MRVTWVILTLGLLWTDHAQSDDATIPSTDTSKSTTPATVTSKSTIPATVTGQSTTPATYKGATPATYKGTSITMATDTKTTTPAAGKSTTRAAEKEKSTTPSTNTGKGTTLAADKGTSTMATDTKTTQNPPTLTLALTTTKNIPTKTSDTRATLVPTAPPVTTKAVGSKATTESTVEDTPASATISGTATTTTTRDNTEKNESPGENKKTEPTPGITKSSSPTMSEGGATSGSMPTTTKPRTAATTGVKMTTLPATTAPPSPFTYHYNKNAENETILTKVCSKLLEMLINGSCSIEGNVLHNGTHVFDTVIIYGNVNTSVVDSHYKEFVEKEKREKEEEGKGRETTVENESDYTTLIAILASCGAVALIIVGLAIYTYRHGKHYRKNQQHLTEELQTVENGYHDNPTLEVMEVQQETPMEKRPNGEFNDSWIVPIDNLLKEELPDEEDTHL